MYICLHVECPLLQLDFNKTWIFLADFLINKQTSNFMKIRPVGTKDGHNEANSRVSKFCECALLTYSMVQSPSWEANWFAASQKIPRISRNPKVHYRTHKRPPPVSILGQPNPVHITTSHLLEIHPNIIHPSTPRSPQWSLYLRFPHQHPIHPPLLTHTRHMPSPSHSSRFYHPHNIGWGVQAPTKPKTNWSWPVWLFG